MEIRKLRKKDVNEVIQIINDAKLLLKQSGIDQWQDGYPNRGTLENDLLNNNGFVACDGNKVLGYAVLQFGKEADYQKIYHGQWKSSEQYATIHRTATGNQFKNKGVMSFIFEQFEKICLSKGITWLRIDTHEDNKTMRNFIEKMGFNKSGTIVLSRSKAQRVAYEKELGY